MVEEYLAVAAQGVAEEGEVLQPSTLPLKGIVYEKSNFRSIKIPHGLGIS